MEKEVGKITHYYDKIGVAIVELASKLDVGDTVKIKRGDEEFEQEISSMQIEHKEVKSAKKGDVVGIKVSQKIKDGAVVLKAD